MKKLTCRDLGGACDFELTAESFEEMGKRSFEHVMEKISEGDQAHADAIAKMHAATPEQQNAWMAEWMEKFNNAPEL